MFIDGNEKVDLSVESWSQGKEVTKRGWLMLAEMQLDGRNDLLPSKVECCQLKDVTRD